MYSFGFSLLNQNRKIARNLTWKEFPFPPKWSFSKVSFNIPYDLITSPFIRLLNKVLRNKSVKWNAFLPLHITSLGHQDGGFSDAITNSISRGKIRKGGCIQHSHPHSSNSNSFIISGNACVLEEWSDPCYQNSWGKVYIQCNTP